MMWLKVHKYFNFFISLKYGVECLAKKEPIKCYIKKLIEKKRELDALKSNLLNKKIFFLLYKF